VVQLINGLVANGILFVHKCEKLGFVVMVRKARVKVRVSCGLVGNICHSSISVIWATAAIRPILYIN